MARIRTIKPQHCTDKELANISLQAHLLWVLNWCFSDDSGVFENDPLLIKSNVFPRREDIRTAQISEWLGQLEKARFIVPLTYNGTSYYINRTFSTHQKIDRPQPSILPEDVIRRTLDEYSTNVRPCIVEYSKVEDRSVGDADKPQPKPPTRDELIAEKKRSFKSLLEPFRGRYTDEMLLAFFDYWAEPHITLLKLKYELQKTWDLRGRLRTWANNEVKFSQKNNR